MLLHTAELMCQCDRYVAGSLPSIPRLESKFCHCDAMLGMFREPFTQACLACASIPNKRANPLSRCRYYINHNTWETTLDDPRQDPSFLNRSKLVNANADPYMRPTSAFSDATSFGVRSNHRGCFFFYDWLTRMRLPILTRQILPS